MAELKRQIMRELSDGPKSFGELTEDIFGCECCNKTTVAERDTVSEAVRALRRERKVRYTIDRKVEKK